MASYQPHMTAAGSGRPMTGGTSLEAHDGRRIPSAFRSQSSCRSALGGCPLQFGVIGARRRRTRCRPVRVTGVRSPWSPRATDRRPRRVTYNDAGDRTHRAQDDCPRQSAQCRISHAFLSECPHWRQRYGYSHSGKKLSHVSPLVVVEWLVRCNQTGLILANQIRRAEGTRRILRLSLS
jgi:hypothetical protein